MPVYPNYELQIGPEADKQLEEERKRMDGTFFRRLLFTRGVGIETQPQSQPEQKRTEQGDCGDFITS